MECIQNNYQDIAKYYQQSYIKLREFGDALFLVGKVSRDEVVLVDSKDNEFVITLHDSYPYNIDMILPNKSMFQFAGSCYNLSRLPARQYHRGITKQNCVIQKLESTKWLLTSVGFDTLEGFINKPVFPTLQDVLNGKQPSYALSTRFACSFDGTLWCDLKRIGKLDKLSKVITVNPLLLLEINNLLTDTQMKNNFLVKGQ